MEPVIAFALGVVCCIVVRAILEHFESAHSLRMRSFELAAQAVSKKMAKEAYAQAMAGAKAFEEAAQRPQE